MAQDAAPAARELLEACSAVEAATRACDRAYRAWLAGTERSVGFSALDEAESDLREAQSRLALARHALSPRAAPREEKSWGAH